MEKQSINLLVMQSTLHGACNTTHSTHSPHCAGQKENKTKAKEKRKKRARKVTAQNEGRQLTTGKYPVKAGEGKALQTDRQREVKQFAGYLTAHSGYK